MLLYVLVSLENIYPTAMYYVHVVYLVPGDVGRGSVFSI